MMKFEIMTLILFVAVFIFLRPAEDFPKKFPQFLTEDLKGNVFTEKIFAGKTTAILIWTTNSPPCLKILEKLPKNLPPDSQIISLIGDKNFDESVVKKFSSITHLKVNDNFAPVLAKIKAVPTVIFVDRHGNLIFSPKFVANSNFILNELILISQKNSSKFQKLNSLQKVFW